MDPLVTTKRRKTSSNHHDPSESRENEGLDSADSINALPHSSLDRITTLPDSVLGLILSCLPTKNAVSTSILSKRWKVMWRTVHNLDFYHFGLLTETYEGEDMRFVEFVNRVLLLTDATSLSRFCLFWKIKCLSLHCNSWVSTAIKRNVSELILRFENRVGPTGYSEPIGIPISVFTCASLRTLELNGGVTINAALEVLLPRLEKLEIFSVNFQSEIAFAKLIRGCPVLNYLYPYMDVDYVLKYFGRKDHITYIIHSTSLRRLKVCFEYYSERPEDIFYCSLMLETSSLEYFKIKGFIHEIFVGESLNSLVKADFRIKLRKFDFPSPDDCKIYVEAVRAFHCAKILTLSSDAMWALSCATISLSTEFKQLVKLVAYIYCFHCNALRQFIQSSEILEDLTVFQRANFQDRVHDQINWIAPLEVPRCLSNTLKKFVLDVFYGFQDERETIRYVLKHGSVLEYVKINLDLYFQDARLDVLKDISKFPRKSPVCEVDFVVDVNGPPVPVRNSNSNSVSGSNDNEIAAEEAVGGCTVEQPEAVASVSVRSSNSDPVSGSNDNTIAPEEAVGNCTVEQPDKVASVSQES